MNSGGALLHPVGNDPEKQSEGSKEKKVALNTEGSPRLNTRAVSQEFINGIISFYFSCLLGYLVTDS